MGQPKVTWLGTNDLDYTITVAFHNRRAEFFIKPDFYHSATIRVKRSIDQGYFNQAITLLVTHSNALHFQGEMYVGGNFKSIINYDGKDRTMSKIPEPTDFSKTPSAEYPYTLIAPTAKNGIVYQGQRYWHKTTQAAAEYATYIYDANPSEKFDLVVVKAEQQIRPKPMIELLTTDFTKTPAT